MKLYNANDYNSVVAAYDSILELAKEWAKEPGSSLPFNNYKNNEFLKSRESIYYNSLVFAKILINNIAMHLSSLEEGTNGIDEDVVTETLFRDLPCLNIVCQNPNASLSEKKHHLKNCLAHGNISLELDTDPSEDPNQPIIGDLVIIADNGYVRGVFSDKELEKLSENMAALEAYAKRGYDTPLISGLMLDNPKSFEEFTNNLKREIIIRRKDRSLLPFNKMKNKYLKANAAPLYKKSTFYRLKKDRVRYAFSSFIDVYNKEGFESFDYKEENLSDRKKEFLINYLKYITNDSITTLIENVDLINSILMDINNSDTDSTSTKTDLPQACIFEFIHNIVTTQNIIYTILKTNPTNADKLYTAKRISLTLTDELEEKFKKYSYEGPFIYASNLLGKSFYLIDFIKEINKPTTGIKFDYNNFSSLRGINATSIRNEYNEGNSSNIPDNSLETTSRVTVGRHRNSSHFFRHFRNALAHGNYKVDFGDYRDVDSYVFTFNDIERDMSNPEKIITEYKFTLTASQLCSILDEFHTRTNDHINRNRLESQFGKQFLEHALKNARISGDNVKTVNQILRDNMDKEKE